MSVENLMMVDSLYGIPVSEWKNIRDRARLRGFYSPGEYVTRLEAENRAMSEMIGRRIDHG